MSIMSGRINEVSIRLAGTGVFTATGCPIEIPDVFCIEFMAPPGENTAESASVEENTDVGGASSRSSSKVEALTSVGASGILCTGDAVGFKSCNCLVFELVGTGLGVGVVGTIEESSEVIERATSKRSYGGVVSSSKETSPLVQERSTCSTSIALEVAHARNSSWLT